MSSADEASVHGDSFSQEGGKPAGVCSEGPGVPRGRGQGRSRGRGRARGQGLELGPPRSGEGEGGRPDPKAYELELEAPWDEEEEGGAVFRGRQGRPGSSADEKGDALDLVPHLTLESAAIVQELMGWEPRGTRRYPSPESFATELSAIWVDAEAGFSARGALAPSSVEAQQASATPLSHPSGPKGGWAWGKAKRCTKSRMTGSGEGQRPSSDSESSDEPSEIQPMRVSICPKGGGQARSSRPREPRDPTGHSSVSVRSREIFLHMPCPLPTSTPRGLNSASTELEAGSSRKMQSMLWSKGGSRPSFPGAPAAAAAVVSGALPRTTPKKKVFQEKKSLEDGSKVSLGRAFPSWGQRLKSTPLEPATFPTILGVPLLGRFKRYSLLPLGTKKSKHSGTGKRSMAQKTQEFQPVAREDYDPSRDAVPLAQVSRPSSSSSSCHSALLL
ncbi:hypothetical protein SUZIE_164255 [Sciurus carolinensis]|uniref:Uncharacterized protein n=1 Tax=Sciurus carolinensis TaxID=30640 RepID=A0AA41T284_SCICA|nr:hypothetical protein [Sciurus carolinensis]